MGGRRNIALFNLKDIRVTWFSIALVVLVFLVQSLFIYRLYNSNLTLLERELNIYTQEIYNTDLNYRFAESLKNDSKQIDSIKVKDVTGRSMPDSAYHEITEPEFTGALNLEIEAYLNERYSIDLTRLDSIASCILEKNDINLNFYSEIVNAKTNKVLSSSLPRQLRSSYRILTSKGIVLNSDQTQILRIVLINPVNNFYSEMVGLVTVSLVLSIVLVCSFYYQRNVFSEQKRLIGIKNDFFSDVSHEMKKPLSIISFVISSMDNNLIFEDVQKRSFYLRMAKTEIERMGNQTEMVLSLVKDDEGIFELEYSKFNLVEMVSDLADKYTYISEKEVEIKMIDEMEDAFMYADAEHVEHMITNLLTNSIKYSKEPVLIEIKLYQDDVYTCISIKDNGVGLTTEQQKHIYDKYYRTRAVSNVKGHGIGLNYVRRMVEKHHGLLLLNSKLDKGTEFTIKIPRSDAA